MKHSLLVFLFVFTAVVFTNATVHVINFSFPEYSPNGLSVKVGDTILWKGDFDKFPLSSVTAPTGANLFVCEKGKTFSYVVAIAGTYKYQCEKYKTDKMSGYFIALAQDTNAETKGGDAMVYINYFSHAFHLVTPVAVPHNTYTITIAAVNGKNIYTGELKADEKDKWIATEEFPSGTYILSATDGTHTFGRKFTK